LRLGRKGQEGVGGVILGVPQIDPSRPPFLTPPRSGGGQNSPKMAHFWGTPGNGPKTPKTGGGDL